MFVDAVVIQRTAETCLKVNYNILKIGFIGQEKRDIAQLISKDLTHVVFCTHHSSNYIIHKLKCSLIQKSGHLRTQKLSLCLN